MFPSGGTGHGGSLPTVQKILVPVQLQHTPGAYESTKWSTAPRGRIDSSSSQVLLVDTSGPSDASFSSSAAPNPLRPLAAQQQSPLVVVPTRRTLFSSSASPIAGPLSSTPSQLVSSGHGAGTTSLLAASPAAAAAPPVAAPQSLAAQFRILSDQMVTMREDMACPAAAAKKSSTHHQPFWAKKKRDRDDDNSVASTDSQSHPPPAVSASSTAASSSARVAAAAPSSVAPQPSAPGVARSKQAQAPPSSRSVPPAAPASTSAAGIARTLFQIPRPAQSSSSSAATSASAAAVVPKCIDDAATLQLFDEIIADLRDDDRIQAPLVSVAFLATDCESSFSISAFLGGRAHLPPHVSPRAADAYVERVIIGWRNVVYVAGKDAGLSLLCKILKEADGAELLTFSPSVLVAILDHSHIMEKRSSRQTFIDFDDEQQPPATSTQQQPTVVYSHSITDLRVMAWMLQPSDPSSDFDAVFLRYMESSNHDQPSSSSSSPFRCSNHPMKSLEGACDRVLQMQNLYRKLYGLLGTKGLLPAFIKQEKRIPLILASMKYEGFLVDMTQCENVKTRTRNEMERLREEAKRCVPSMPDFNLQSHDDCRVALYDILKLDARVDCNDLTVTKGGKKSTDSDNLQVLAPHHPLPRLLIAYRHAAKILQTYVEGVLEQSVPLPVVRESTTMDALSGSKRNLRVVYGNFLQETTDTGRLSCADPNMQTVPRRTKERDAVEDDLRRCFVAPSGSFLVAIDYEQIELRVLAHLSGDVALVNALSGQQSKEASDIHRMIAATIYRKPASVISSEERSKAKSVVFGVLYGSGVAALARHMNETVDHALKIQQGFKSSFPQIERYCKRIIEKCRSEKCVRTLAGRWRPLPDIDDPSFQKRSAAERQAFNTVIQGSAADVVKKAMVLLHASLLRDDPSIRLLCQIHDELIFSVPVASLTTVVPRLVECMTSCFQLLVPLRVTVKVGPSLGAMEDWTVDHSLGLFDTNGELFDSTTV